MRIDFQLLLIKHSVLGNCAQSRHDCSITPLILKQEFQQEGEGGDDTDVGGVTVIFAVTVTHGGERHTCGVCRVDTKGTQTDVL